MNNTNARSALVGYTSQPNSAPAGQTDACCATRQGQIPEKAAVVQAIIEQLGNRVSVLLERSSVILRPEAPCPCTPDGKPQECLAPMADALQELARRINDILNRVDNAISRLET